MNRKFLELSFFGILLTLNSCGNSSTEEENGGIDPVSPVEELKISNTVITSGYIGNGVEFGLYEHCDDALSSWGKEYGMYMDDAMWQKTFERLDFMRPQLVRTMISSKSFAFRGNDPAGIPIVDYTNKIGLVDKWLDYCDQRNIPVLWGEWGTGTIAPVTDPKWSNVVIGYADYLIRERGHDCIKYFIGVNEPDGNWSDATGGNFVTWKTGIENAYSELIARGLSDKLQIAGPDACPGITGPTFISYTANQLKDKIGIWDLHIYPYPSDIRNGSYEKLIRQWYGIMGNDKKLVLGEVGMKYQAGTAEYAENQRRALADPMGKTDPAGSNMFVYDFSYGIDIADLYIQCMRGGISGGCSWMVCDAMNTGPGQKMKRWGLWNIFGTKMGHPEDEEIRPWYYTLSLLCRYFPSGTDILDVSASSLPGVRVIAGKANGKLTVAVVNNSDKDGSVRLKMEGGGEQRMKKYVYMENDRPVDENQFPVVKDTKTFQLGSGEMLELPAKSFVLLTSLEY